MTVDQLLAGVASGPSDILAAVAERLKTPPCRFGSLLETLHELDLSINQEPAGLHKEAQIARHQLTELNLRALVKEGSLGCKKCPCCARFTSSEHICEITREAPPKAAKVFYHEEDYE
jgi:hypothetical protein